MQAFMTLDPSDPGFRETMLRAIETGAVLLLENLDEDMDDMIEQVGDLTSVRVVNLAGAVKGHDGAGGVWE
jgi:hypothetical protein